MTAAAKLADGRELVVSDHANTTFEDRWLAKVSIPADVGSCWLWTGAKMSSGYGRICLDRSPNGRNLAAHRVGYALFVAPIPAGWFALHTCNNGGGGCVNPWHIRLGRHVDNMQDMVRAGRQTHGIKSSSAKLTESQVAAIRADTSRSQQRMAEEHGVSPSTISLIRSGRRWRLAR